MAFFNKFLAVSLPLLWLVLTAVAGYAYSKIIFLSLPISKALGLFTVILPLISGISTNGTSYLIQRSSKKEKAGLTIPLIAVIGFQLIYETIVVTLAATHIIPPSALRCGLDTKWDKLFKVKDEEAIRAIQDSFNCCGLNTLKDRAWPFNSNGPSQCAAYTKRTSSCFGAWRQAEQVNAGLLVLVAVIVFIVNMLSLISLLTNTWTRPRWAGVARQISNGTSGESDDDPRATMRRLIEEGNPVEEYHDEPEQNSSRAIQPPSSEEERRPRVEPSDLVEHGNAWRD